MLKKELVTEARRLGMRPSVAGKARKADLEEYIKNNSVAARRAARRRARQPQNLPPVPKAMHAGGLDAIREAATKTSKDTFAVGDVVRWVAAGQYTYAAVKTQIGWFTTASPGNPYVRRQLDFDELLEVLARSEVTEIAVAINWEFITE